MANTGTKESGLPSKIVVGTDGSETAERGATSGRAGQGGRCPADHRHRLQQPGAERGGGCRDDLRRRLGGRRPVRRGEKCAAESAEKVMANGLDKVSTMAVGGEPAEALIQAAENEGAELLVVGSKGMHKTARFLMGPIANKVSRRMACDLLIVETESGDSPVRSLAVQSQRRTLIDWLAVASSDAVLRPEVGHALAVPVDHRLDADVAEDPLGRLEADHPHGVVEAPGHHPAAERLGDAAGHVVADDGQGGGRRLEVAGHPGPQGAVGFARDPRDPRRSPRTCDPGPGARRCGRRSRSR